MSYLDKAGLAYFWSKLKDLLNGKADSSHSHAASEIATGTLDSERLPIVPIVKGGTEATTAAEAREKLGITPENIGAATESYVNDVVATNYNESIIGLSVDGQTITYIKGDGSVHTIVTQDTDTTYSIGTDEVSGLTKLYATTGSAEDGTMTQKAIQTELEKKVGVTVDAPQNTLIFTK